MHVLQERDLEHWREQGYVVVPEAVPPELVQAVVDAIWAFQETGEATVLAPVRG